jgi:hypothetical protein
MGGQVIFFAMVHGGSPVSVRGEFVKLSGSLVRVIRHSVSDPGNQQDGRTNSNSGLSNCGHF